MDLSGRATLRTFWLASYPKSGNTWFRIFLSNLLFPEQSPVDPNRLPLNNLIASARSPFQEIIGVPPALLTPDECDNLRPGIDQIIGRDWDGLLCARKTHDAYTYLPDGRPLMGERPDFSAVYLVRNPWDVAVSAANHWGIALEESVDRLCRDNMTLDYRQDRSTAQIRQRLLSWSGHVGSWLSAPLDVCLLRYEDMHAEPLQTFRRATVFLGVSATDAEIQRAVEASRFDRLQQIEQTHGFREAPKNRQFFRAGQMGKGRRQLSEKDRKRLDDQYAIVEATIEKHLQEALT